MGISQSYDTRVYTLQANVPVALPPGRDYAILSASIDADLVELSVGDNNGTGGTFPYGVTVRTETPVQMRLFSSVAQTVVLIVTGGDVSFRDNRPPMYPIGGTSAFNLSGAAAGVTSIVAPALNVNGIIIYGAGGSVAATAALNANFGLLAGAQNPFRMMAPAPSTVNVPFVMPQPWLVAPGNELFVNNSNATPFSFYCIYKVL